MLIRQAQEARFWRSVNRSYESDPLDAFAQLHPAASCCRENGAKVAADHNRTRRSCAAACMAHPRCHYFSHGGAANRCELCAACDLQTGSFAGKYSSWQVTQARPLLRCSCAPTSELASIPCGVHCPLDAFGWSCDLGCSALAPCSDPQCILPVGGKLKAQTIDQVGVESVCLPDDIS